MSTSDIQYQNPNGSWTDCGERAEEFLARAIAFYANHPNLKPLTRDEALAKLAAGETLSHREDWYAEIRMRPAPRPAASVELVLAGCGHRVPRASVMSASLGTACPDCYDRLSA